MNPEESPLESLFHKATDYGKSSIELIKLKSIDKTADFVSSFLSRLIDYFNTDYFYIFYQYWPGRLDR
jgi:hypothetical protein